jgi:hypothetical protein
LVNSTSHSSSSRILTLFPNDLHQNPLFSHAVKLAIKNLSLPFQNLKDMNYVDMFGRGLEMIYKEIKTATG